MDPTVRLLCGGGLGAAVMYFLDPQPGRGRRAPVREKILFHEVRDTASVVSRDAANRATGLWAEARAAISGRTHDDRTLAERVRAHLGGCVSHPRAIAIAADNGTVTLSGPILEPEVDELIGCVKSVSGVRDLVNRLEVHDSPGQHSSLQGGISRTGARGEFCQANWSQAFRTAIGAIGGGLMVRRLSQRNLLSIALGTVGFGLLLRAATNTGLGELLEEVLPEFPAEGRADLWMAAAAGPVL